MTATTTAMRTPVRVNPVLMHPQEQRISLSGEWGFLLDPADKGLGENWSRDIGLFPETIQVPGCWQGQGFGGGEKETVWDFRLEARTFRATYRGTGWYGRLFRVPDDWGDRRIWLNFGGAHPSAEVWLNGQRLGENHAPFVPFGFDVTDVVRQGDDNAVAVRVHEQARIYGLSFNFQGAWSGLYRDVELTAAGPLSLGQIRIHPDVDGQALRIKVLVAGAVPDDDLTVELSAACADGSGAPLAATASATAGWNEFELPAPAPRLWSPDSPELYRVDVVLRQDETVLDAASERTGFVKLTTEGKHMLVNGEPYYIRSSGEFHSNPETGCPDTSRERWRKKLGALRAYGYNHVRCQSFVPAPEYFDVADEVGLFVQSEMGMLGGWCGHSAFHIYAWPQPNPGFREQLKRQWDCVVRRDVNHPSANFYCMSNELRGTHYPRTAWRCCRDTKAVKPGALVIWTDGGYAEDLPQDFVNAEAGLDEQCGKPLIQHEFRWWSSFPDVRIMAKYSGAVRPYAAKIAIAAAQRNGIEHILIGQHFKPRPVERVRRIGDQLPEENFPFGV